MAFKVKSRSTRLFKRGSPFSAKGISNLLLKMGDFQKNVFELQMTSDMFFNYLNHDLEGHIKEVKNIFPGLVHGENFNEEGSFLSSLIRLNFKFPKDFIVHFYIQQHHSYMHTCSTVVLCNAKTRISDS